MKSLYMLAAPPLDSIRTEEQHTTEQFGIGNMVWYWHLKNIWSVYLALDSLSWRWGSEQTCFWSLCNPWRASKILLCPISYLHHPWLCPRGCLWSRTHQRRDQCMPHDTQKSPFSFGSNKQLGWGCRSYLPGQRRLIWFKFCKIISDLMKNKQS